jgi:hypothetical protein
MPVILGSFKFEPEKYIEPEIVEEEQEEDKNLHINDIKVEILDE